MVEMMSTFLFVNAAVILSLKNVWEAGGRNSAQKEVGPSSVVGDLGFRPS